jgi:glucosamine--fructose-6-phosphate aminotransferase (isomerizing)
MEGSLKLKEISYIHSEAYAAGELKHGTISLIEKGTPVIALATDEDLYEKTISNIKEVKARGAYVVLLISDDLDIASDYYDDVLVIPKVDKLIQGILTVIPLQLMAYEIARLRGCEIDQPRNLAKSVTVE